MPSIDEEFLIKFISKLQIEGNVTHLMKGIYKEYYS